MTIGEAKEAGTMATLVGDDAAPADCSRALDVVFLVDSSSDVSDSDWKSSLNLVSRVSSQLNSSMSGTHVGMLVFASTNTSTVYPLGHQPPSFKDPSKTQQRGRDLAAGINSVRSLMFNNRDGDRPEVPDVLVTITHRASDNVPSSFAAAEQLKSDGIRIITVGIGSGGVDELRAELLAIASYPRESDRLVSHYYFIFLPQLLLKAICRREFNAVKGTLRLADESAASGRLEVFVRGEWVTVCAGRWSRRNTEVACRELGFPGALSWYTFDKETLLPQRRTGLGNVTCAGSESRLVDCPHDPLFVVQPSCDYRRDVFLQCLCADCADYRARDNMRLVDGGSMYGRPEVFSPAHGWRGICRSGWSLRNTRVICRHLGFLDGAATYSGIDTARPIAISLGQVDCLGNESSLFDCNYTVSTNNNCREAVNVLCRCKVCLEPNLRQSPHAIQATTGSSVEFEWKLSKSVIDGDFEFWFLSRKNQRLVIRRIGDQLTTENTELRNRVELIGDNDTTVGFRLANAARTDMGTYALYVPQSRLFNSQAILFVTDFAVTADPVVRRRVGDSVTLYWDLTALRQLREVTLRILLTTPATGRMHFDYYNAHWMRDNEPRHSVAQPADHLRPTVFIDEITVKDAGNYAVEVRLTSSVHRWLNASWQFTTVLVLDHLDGSRSVLVIVLATLLSVTSAGMCVLLLLACRRKTKRRKAATRVQTNLIQAVGSIHRERLEDDNNYDETEIYDDGSRPSLPIRDYHDWSR